MGLSDLTSLEQLLHPVIPTGFQQSELYQLALTHPSFANEHNGRRKGQHNERLEFLGDSVLGLCITEYLYRRFPGRSEGQLAKLKSYIVSAESLACAAREHRFGDFIFLGKGEQQDGGEEKDSVLANATEALIGACYLDQGIAVAHSLVLFLLQNQLERYQDSPSPQDVKLQLQEYIQKCYHTLPHYETQELFVPGSPGGKAAKPQSFGFEAKLYINEVYAASGQGSSKKQAEKQAAQCALQKLQEVEYE